MTKEIRRSYAGFFAKKRAREVRRDSFLRGISQLSDEFTADQGDRQLEGAFRQVSDVNKGALTALAQSDEFVVFISHRKDDRVIAETIRDNLIRWSIPSRSIFLSCLKDGSRANAKLMSKLTEANLVILVCTIAEADWYYCMWECGVATDPRTQRACIVFFQCLQGVPILSEKYEEARAEWDSLKNFVTRFHRESGFIPRREGVVPNRLEGAFAPGITDGALLDWINQLHDDLQASIEKWRSRDHGASAATSPAEGGRTERARHSVTVFISYARCDLEKAQEVQEYLRQLGHHGWMDIADIPAGQDWKKAIESAMRRADLCVVILSGQCLSRRGSFVHKEHRLVEEILESMPEGEVFAIPVKLEATLELPSVFRRLQWVDASHPSWLTSIGAVVGFASEKKRAGTDE